MHTFTHTWNIFLEFYDFLLKKNRKNCKNHPFILNLNLSIDFEFYDLYLVFKLEDVQQEFIKLTIGNKSNQ